MTEPKIGQCPHCLGVLTGDHKCPAKVIAEVIAERVCACGRAFNNEHSIRCLGCGKARPLT